VVTLRRGLNTAVPTWTQVEPPRPLRARVK
jgi:hypothetical protein